MVGLLEHLPGFALGAWTSFVYWARSMEGVRYRLRKAWQAMLGIVALGLSLFTSRGARCLATGWLVGSIWAARLRPPNACCACSPFAPTFDAALITGGSVLLVALVVREGLRPDRARGRGAPLTAPAVRPRGAAGGGGSGPASPRLLRTPDYRKVLLAQV